MKRSLIDYSFPPSRSFPIGCSFTAALLSHPHNLTGVQYFFIHILLQPILRLSPIRFSASFHPRLFITSRFSLNCSSDVWFSPSRRGYPLTLRTVTLFPYLSHQSVSPFHMTPYFYLLYHSILSRPLFFLFHILCSLLSLDSISRSRSNHFSSVALCEQGTFIYFFIPQATLPDFTIFGLVTSFEKFSN